MKTMKVPVLDTMSNNLLKKLGNLSDKEQNLIVFLIGQLGRDTSYSKDYLDGKQMLQACYGLIGSARDIVGGRLILVECKPIEKICKLYEDEGFVDIIEDNPLRSGESRSDVIPELKIIEQETFDMAQNIALQRSLCYRLFWESATMAL